MEQPLPDSKSCVLCAVLIPASASFCKECKNYQSKWVRLFHSLDLSNLTAFVSSAGLAIGVIHSKLIFPYSSIQFAPLECTNTAERVAVSNSGNRPAIYRRAYLTKVEDGAGNSQRYPLIEDGEIDPIIKPQAARVFHLKPRDPIAPSAVPVCYGIEIETLDFGNSASTSSGGCPCR